MLIGWEWPVQIILINFGTQDSAEKYSSEEFDGWGVHPYARVWRSYLQAILNECYFLIPPMRRCNNVIPHFMYSDIIVVWMWYLTGIWVIWSTTVLLHFDAMDFPSWKSGSFQVSCVEDSSGGLRRILVPITRCIFLNSVVYHSTLWYLVL